MDIHGSRTKRGLARFRRPAGVHRREPAWSPDGKTIAYITDERGVQEIALQDTATAKERILPLGQSPGFYSGILWSPDSKLIAYSDEKLNLWTLDPSTGKNTKVDTLTYRGRSSFQPSWSPDSKWLAFAKDLDTHYGAIFLHNVAGGKTTQVTDGFADAQNPEFDRDGKHLYFLASTDIGKGIDFENISSLSVPNSSSSVYCIVLKKDGPNPLHPESDEETPKDPAAPAAPKPTTPPATPPEVVVDLEGIEERIITLPMPTAGYGSLRAGPASSFFVISSPPRANATSFGPAQSTLHKWTWSDRKFNTFSTNVGGYAVTADGQKMVLRSGASVSIVPTTAPPAPGAGVVPMTGLRVKVDPKVEWTRMYEEAWRNQRMLFYAPNMHGMNVPMMMDRYRPFLANIYSRDDLNYLFTDMFGEINVGHMFIGGGDIPGASNSVPGGLLGADYSFANGRYKLAKIYNGERWNPGLYAPLAQPGVRARVGEYILAIDGKDLTDATDIYEALEGKANRQVKVKIGPNPDGSGSREVTVVPVGNEAGLRQIAWVEDNRRKVAQATGGRGAYVHVPDTGGGGWAAFQRYFYAQSGKDGLIVDDRFNHGGYINDFMVKELTKTLD
ncbi:MAG TPA: PDZ domain-containing protein, partial [Fimbriimonadaceae bacterium]|nr:PDZ domain-containing protein [Fimbriimonadaceae bacterium]